MPIHDDTQAAPDTEVLSAFDADPASVARAPSGLINASWYAQTSDGRRIVLQRLNRIFPAAVNDDIAAVTEHLARAGLTTPKLVPTAAGARWLEAAGQVWRALTYVDGASYDAVGSAARAAEAGRVLAEFHRALADLEHGFHNARPGVHDTPRHLEALGAALEAFDAHAEIAAVRRLARDALEIAESIDPLPALPDRVVHGDPKISNILFDSTSGRALCLIDLDTVGPMPIAVELGDAFRSWCNPATEDSADARFSIELFEAATQAYAKASGGWLTAPEWLSIPDATLTITIELAARFCADALSESYFAWDRNRFESASRHNQARTRGQLAVARGIRSALGPMRDIVRRAFADSP